MKFESEFYEYTNEYSRKIENRFTKFNAAFNKWKHEDLVPGLSDIDSRIICDEMSFEDWLTLDKVIGQVHLEVVNEHPEWSRMAEHNPGIVLTVDEITRETTYVTDMHQWIFYYGDENSYDIMKNYLNSKPWSEADEFFHLKKFFGFFTPYNHDIDPPINIPQRLIRSYYLHSRIKHYFIPAVMCVICIFDKKTYDGKHDVLRRCMELYPNEQVLCRVWDIIEKVYEVPERENDEKMVGFEDDCYKFMQKIFNELLPDSIESFDTKNKRSPEDIKSKVYSRQGSPIMTMSDTVRFARTRAGRLYFYLNAPAFFDASLLLTRHETNWLKNLFTKPFFDSYAQLKWNRNDLHFDDIIDRIHGDIITSSERKIVKRMYDIAWNQLPNRIKDTKILFQNAYEMFDEYHYVLNKIYDDAIITLKK